MNLYKNYYLIKAFSKQSYRDQFNSGNKIYIKSVEYFHNNGDGFQQDFEGGIFRQSVQDKGMLLFSKEHNSIEQIIEKCMNNQFSGSDVVIPTTDFKIFIQGYICCFSLLSKKLIKINSDSIVFADNSSAQKDFYDFLNGYAKSQGYTFLSIYDAESFIPLFRDEIAKKGYIVNFGEVQYLPVTMEKRIRDYQNRDIHNIIFTKDKSYSYQKEFRFFIQKKDEYKDHIEIDGIDLQSSVICNWAYLTNEYIQNNHLKIKKRSS